MEFWPTGKQALGLLRNGVPRGLLGPEAGGLHGVSDTDRTPQDHPRCGSCPVSPGTPQKISVDRISSGLCGAEIVKYRPSSDVDRISPQMSIRPVTVLNAKSLT